MAILHKRKSTSNYTWTSSDLASGQIGVNLADGTLHIKKSDNSVATIYNGLEVPTQTGNSGKYLTTNGTTTSWATVSGGGATGYLYSGTVTTAPVATGEDAIVIGDGATASTFAEAIVIGKSATSGSTQNVVIGSSASATGANSVAIGKGTTANAASTTALGQGSTTSGQYSINIGTLNSVTGTNCVILTRGVSCSSGSVTGIGYGLTTNSNCAEATGVGSSVTLSNGPSSTALGSYCSTNGGSYAIAIGYSCSSGAANAITIGASGGVQNLSNSNASSVWLGYGGKTDYVGEFAFGTGQFVTNGQGSAKLSFAVLHTQTTDATATELGTSTPTATLTPTNRIILVNDCTYLFDVDIVARNTATDTESKVWNLKFGIRRGAAAANTAIIGTATKTVFGGDTGTETWDISVTADTTNGRPNISVTGEAAKTIRWVANIRQTTVKG